MSKPSEWPIEMIQDHTLFFHCNQVIKPNVCYLKGPFPLDFHLSFFWYS